MSYVTPHMVEALAGHFLTTVAIGKPLETVQLFAMRRPGTNMWRVQVTFTPEGIAIQGDIGLGAGHGVCSCPGYGFEWFAGLGRPQFDGKLTETYLCEKFLRREFQRDVAIRDVKRRRDEAHTDGPHETYLEWQTLFENIERADNEHDAYQTLWEAYSDDLDFEDVGMDYPLADAGWLCAIQQRFAALVLEARREHRLAL